MNSRQRKKYEYVSLNCAHNKSYDEQVLYYEYCNIPRQVFVCARQPQYTQHFTDEIAESRWEICEGCKSFTLSRETMRLGRERKKAEKWVNRHFFQKEITIDPTSLKFKKSSKKKENNND